MKRKEKIVSFSFRNKDKGWNSSGLQLGTLYKTESGKEYRLYPFIRDSFMIGFLEDLYLRPSCYNCKFKSLKKNYSDFTIGDFWGVKRHYPELYSRTGTSLVLINSEKGNNLFSKINKDFFYKKVNLEYLISSNKSIVQSARVNHKRNRFFLDLDRYGFNVVRKKYLNLFLCIFSIAINKIKQN